MFLRLWRRENDKWVCGGSVLNKESEVCNLDPFLKITAGKLLIRWNWPAEERPRNVTPNPTCFPTKSRIENADRAHIDNRKNRWLFSFYSSLSHGFFKFVFPVA